MELYIKLTYSYCGLILNMSLLSENRHQFCGISLIMTIISYYNFVIFASSASTRCLGSCDTTRKSSMSPPPGGRGMNPSSRPLFIYIDGGRIKDYSLRKSMLQPWILFWYTHSGYSSLDTLVGYSSILRQDTLVYSLRGLYTRPGYSSILTQDTFV